MKPDLTSHYQSHTISSETGKLPIAVTRIPVIRPLRSYVDPALLHRSSVDTQIHDSLNDLMGVLFREFRVRIVLSENTLVTFCRDRGAATEVRFLQREILKVLCSIGYGRVTSVKIRMMPPFSPTSNPRENQKIVERSLSKPIRDLLRSTASSIRDPDLQRVLNKLSTLG